MQNDNKKNEVAEVPNAKMSNLFIQCYKPLIVIVHYARLYSILTFSANLYLFMDNEIHVHKYMT